MKYLILLLFSLVAHAETGLVLLVHDGDTMTMQTSQGKERIRISKEDAPELGQPYGTRSRAALKDLCYGKQAEFTRKGKSYDRVVAKVLCNGVDVATYQIENGNAWLYRYSSDKQLSLKQKQAQADSLGLWAYKNPIEPILWRKGIR